jgi:hypothetical protein
VLFELLTAVMFFAQDTTGATAPPSRPKTELNFVPVVGGDSDVGIGIGVIGDLARLDPGFKPFRWRLELGAITTFKLEGAQGTGTGTGAFTIPFQDYYLEMVLPQLTSSRRLRIEARPSFTWESTQKFYGVGNASPHPAPGVPRGQTEYGRRRVALTAGARVRLHDRLHVRAAASYSQNWLQIPADTILAQQRLNAAENVRRLLDGPVDFGAGLVEAGVEWDSRDNEVATRNGSWHHLKLRFSPRLGPQQPYRYGGANVTLRVYRAPFRWLEVAGRLVGDMLVGDPPFYELTRVDDSSVVGGGKGIRGVPGQRYYGKVKAFGNVETRVQTWHGTIRGKPFALSVAGFFDGGRVWSDLPPSPELDGRGLGLRYGLGGGLRLQEGQTFVVRADVAWSPDAEPIGVYFNAGEIF